MHYAFAPHEQTSVTNYSSFICTMMHYRFKYREFGLELSIAEGKLE